MQVESGLSPLSSRILYGCLQRVTIPEAVVIQLVLLRLSSCCSKHVEERSVTYILLKIKELFIKLVICKSLNSERIIFEPPSHKSDVTCLYYVHFY